ncbi:MAG TPA: DALR anticodon-binding domain-containing protein [Pyrinomonadaceae bacterium]|nr:DALR anticodon-binding domain-containing protein [Pyrinomonadaceae bacterium]
MTLIEIQDRLKQATRSAAIELLGIELEQVNAETPPRPELGDLAFPVSFELAKLIKQGTGVKTAPRAIAEQLKAKLEKSPEVARVDVAGAGYLNVFFDRAKLLSSFAPAPQAQLVAPSPVADRPKKMVEHTSINPNKAAHIGHVRNAVLGDTFVRILQAANERIEIQNYIDNTGVQVADVVVGFMHIEKMNLNEIKALDSSLPSNRPFDYYCWDLYTKVGLFYRDGDASAAPDPDRLKLRDDVLHALEEGNNPVAELADYVATRNVECILDTMERLGIRYDLLARESDILHLHFWDRAFELMKEAGVIHLQTEGKHAGCWVMPFESHTGTDEHESDKIIVRSNGTVTYTGKDIAYQLWKLGRLGLDFNYKPFRFYADGHVAWVTTAEPNAEILPEVPRPNFGGGVKVYNVIDSRQAYPQEIVARGVAAVVPDVGADASVHFGYEMVALSPRACEELGIELSEEDRARPFIEMSGRKGLGVKADDLINRLETDALREVSSRHPELSEDEQRATAHEIAVGALRYFLLKFTRNSVIAFDFKEALSFEGETGPYCQYAAVRANSIFRKLEAEAINQAEELLTAEAGSAKVSEVLEDEPGTEIWSLVMLAERLDEVIAQCAASAEPANLAKYTFTLARAFNLFYHRHRIIAEEDQTKRAVLIVAANIARRRLTAALATLGIVVPERM